MAIPTKTAAEYRNSITRDGIAGTYEINGKTVSEEELQDAPSIKSFGSNPLPDRVEIQRETLVEPASNEVRAENERHKLPVPHGWNILIVPYSQPRQSKGGILFSNKTVEIEQLATNVGYVVEVGPLAYQDPAKFGKDLEPWCKPGDYVVFGRYAGARIKMRGEEGQEDLACRLLSDDEILATIADPEDYVGVS